MHQLASVDAQASLTSSLIISIEPVLLIELHHVVFFYSFISFSLFFEFVNLHPHILMLISCAPLSYLHEMPPGSTLAQQHHHVT